VSKIQDPVSKSAIEIQVNEYGQAPKQLFKSPHPKKFSNSTDELVVEAEKENKEIPEKIENEKIEIIHEKIESHYSFNRDFTCLPKFHKKYKSLTLERSLLLYFKMIARP
jgi:hypothetical protein